MTARDGRFVMGMMADVADMYSDLLSQTMRLTAETTHKSGGV